MSIKVIQKGPRLTTIKGAALDKALICGEVFEGTVVTDSQYIFGGLYLSGGDRLIFLFDGLEEGGAGTYLLRGNVVEIQNYRPVDLEIIVKDRED